MAYNYIYDVVEGNSLPNIEFQCKNQSGEVIPLDATSVVKFSYREMDTDTILWSVSCTTAAATTVPSTTNASRINGTADSVKIVIDGSTLKWKAGSGYLYEGLVSYSLDGTNFDSVRVPIGIIVGK